MRSFNARTVLVAVLALQLMLPLLVQKSSSSRPAAVNTNTGSPLRDSTTDAPASSGAFVTESLRTYSRTRDAQNGCDGCRRQ